MNLRKHWVTIAGVLILVVTNVVAIGGALRNRSGTPDSMLTLTERELSLPYSDWYVSENSGLALDLRWQLEDSRVRQARSMWFGSEANWLDGAKLAELGITVRPRAARNADRPSRSTSVPADVLLVLEMNGPAYRRQLDHFCKSTQPYAKEQCERQRNLASRLFAVDAGLDRSLLRKKYPDTKMYAIVRGQVEGAIIPEETGPVLTGFVSGVSVNEIYVPLSLRAAFGNAGNERKWTRADRERPFEARVAFGRRLEPYLVSVSAH